MSLTKKGPNEWLVKAQVWDKSKGYPVSKQATVKGTRAEAVIVEGDLLKELKARSLTGHHASTFAEAVDKYVEKLSTGGRLSPSYKSKISILRRDLGHVRIEAFTEHFEAYRKHLMNTPSSHGKPRGPASINQFTGLVISIFNHLINLDVIDKNPIRKARFPDLKTKPRDRYLTQEERLRLLSAIREHRPEILPIVKFMLAVPCRKMELVLAKKEQFIPFTDPPHIYIPDSKADIPIHKPIPEDMIDYFRNIPEDCEWLFYRKTSSGYLPLTNLKHTWAFCLKKAGITDMHIHDLRHMAVTDLIDAGNSVWVIKDIAGWKTDMTSTYRHKNGLRSAQKTVFKPTAEVIEFRQAASL
jgi:integrase